MVKSRKKNRELVAKFLPSILKEKGWEKQLDLHSIFHCWQELAGPDVGDHAQPLKIERGILWIEVENSSWLQQLQYQKLELLESLNDFLSLGRINDIKMVLPKKKDKNPYEQNGDLNRKVQFIRPSSEKILQFEQQANCISDEKCRQALMQFWYLANACKRDEE